MNLLWNIMPYIDINNVKYNGSQHWVYYLLGAIFFVLFILCSYYAYRWRNSRKEAENFNYEYSELTRFWQLNKFGLMVMLAIIFLLCSIVFFLMNPLILNKG